jgi:N-acetylneuraminic acid mutarotase
MGSQMVHYKDKLYVYSGAELSEQSSTVYSDFFSFNMETGMWKKEEDYSELNAGDGTMLGKAVRM